MIYWDASAVMALVFREPRATTLVDVWHSDTTRVASRALEAEAVTVVRRAAQLGGMRDASSAKQCAEDLDALLHAIFLVDLDRSVTDALRATSELGRVRSLDAIHLATATYVRDNSGFPLSVCTLDDRMGQSAGALGFTVLPDAR